MSDRGKSGGHARYRKHAVRQLEQFGKLDAAIAHHADGTATETGGPGDAYEVHHDERGIDTGVEHGIQVVVCERSTAQLADARRPGRCGSRSAPAVTSPWSVEIWVTIRTADPRWEMR